MIVKRTSGYISPRPDPGELLEEDLGDRAVDESDRHLEDPPGQVELAHGAERDGADEQGDAVDPQRVDERVGHVEQRHLLVPLHEIEAARGPPLFHRLPEILGAAAEIDVGVGLADERPEDQARQGAQADEAEPELPPAAPIACCTRLREIVR